MTVSSILRIDQPPVAGPYLIPRNQTRRSQSMSETVATTCIGSLFVMVIVWLGLVLWLFHRLRHRHAATYEAIGSPSLFWNNSMRNNWLFLKFLFQGQWQSLGDSQLAIVARFMQIFLVLYLVAFGALFAALMLLGSHPG